MKPKTTPKRTPKKTQEGEVTLPSKPKTTKKEKQGWINKLKKFSAVGDF